MKILAIETSCDETSIAILKVKNGDFEVLSHKTLSQVETHKEYGGVFPALAKREHALNLIPVLDSCLSEIEYEKSEVKLDESKLQKILEREPDLLKQFLEEVSKIGKPDIDLISVTHGPGLEPALWVGINFSKALSATWNVPVMPINHMEGHIYSVLMNDKEKADIKFPSLALLISGGHTELVLIKDWLHYEILGQTRDDAIGEAFDKVARLLDLPYPGGPEISKLAEKKRQENVTETSWDFPKPMINSDDYDFSFSGLKTAILYAVQKKEKLGQNDKEEIALEFENTVTEVLIKKTKKALDENGVKTLIIGGGVIANKHIRKSFEKMSEEENVSLHIPEQKLTTDNALMIALATFVRLERGEKGVFELDSIKAQGNLKLN